MKQRITFFLGIFTLICVVLAGCSKDNGTTAPQIENINLNQSDITLNPGDSYTLTAETTPEDIEVTLIWSSSAPDIVSVDNSGDCHCPGHRRGRNHCLNRQRPECRVQSHSSRRRV